MSHPAITFYEANKTAMNESYMLEWMVRQMEHSVHCRALPSTAEFQALKALITHPDPFMQLNNAILELSVDELKYLADELPSGYFRAMVIDRIPESPIPLPVP